MFADTYMYIGWHSGTMGRDGLVTCLTPAPALLHNNLRQVVHTLVPLSPSRISCYWCKNQEGNGRLWKRCGLPSITPVCCMSCQRVGYFTFTLRVYQSYIIIIIINYLELPVKEAHWFKHLAARFSWDALCNRELKFILAITGSIQSAAEKSAN